MDITIQKKEAFKVGGIDRKGISYTLCPVVWDDLYNKFTHEELATLGKGQSVGVCHDSQVGEKLNYMAGYIIEDIEQTKTLGLDILEIEEAEYAVVELKGPVPECIHDGWKYVYEKFFPENNFKHSGQADFEYYFEGDMTSSDYQMELWVPIEKVTD